MKLSPSLPVNSMEKRRLLPSTAPTLAMNSIYRNSQDVYRALFTQAAADTLHPLTALLGYALIAEKHFDWIEHKTCHQQPPDNHMQQQWYHELPPTAVEDALQQAITILTQFADEHQEQVIALREEQIRTESVIEEVRNGFAIVQRRNRGDFARNIVAGLLSTFIYTFMIIVLYLYAKYQPNMPQDIGLGEYHYEAK